MAESEQQGGYQQATFRDVRETLWKAAEQFGEMVVPSPEARKHFQQARVQLLMGIRELVDRRIAHLNRDETKGTKVTVD